MEEAKVISKKLKILREKIQPEEGAYCDEIKRNNQTEVRCTLSSRPATMKLRRRQRIVPLTRKDIQEALEQSLIQKFKHRFDQQEQQDTLKQFALDIASYIWTNRQKRTKESIVFAA